LISGIKQIESKAVGLDGPILIFGAGGFIGVNLLTALLKERRDVYGVSQDPKRNWRFRAAQIPEENLLSCDINEYPLLVELVKEVRPKTVFNLAAYGAYSKQKEFQKIHLTNYNATIDVIECLKSIGFSVYVHAGSSSEYGINSCKPEESSELLPNSHYAVSKAAAYYALKYYGKIEKLPVLHLRLYSAYGPWEEPDRLIPLLIAYARKKDWPMLVEENISRDFIYVDDVVDAMISVAAQASPKVFGDAFNVGSGQKTTIRELVETTGKVFEISKVPQFGSMDNRKWDLPEWYADVNRIQNTFGWKSNTPLHIGLYNVAKWQELVGFDDAFWNWMKRL
jgi:nucleoside-diphosphate-sugar epimerase